MTDEIRVLVVEDEQHLAAGLKLNLELEGFQVDVAETAREASRQLLQRRYDTVILDVMLPDTSGFELCSRLRSAGNFVPVLMLTARSSLDDRVRGLDAGADDYVAKPFDLKELVARVHSMVRRRSWEDRRRPEGVQTFRFGSAEIDFETSQVRVSGQEYHLTHLELELLQYFVMHPERVISREELLESVWKLRDYPNTRTVDNFILRLRKIFEPDPTHPRYFVSVRGRGYSFRPDGAPGPSGVDG
jgi:DNA-binding response OmpR family regulator